MSTEEVNMKKGIEVSMERDCTWRSFLKITKQRGQLSIDEITEAAREYEMDIYALIIRALDNDTAQYYYDSPGDCVELYPVGHFFEKE